MIGAPEPGGGNAKAGQTAAKPKKPGANSDLDAVLSGVDDDRLGPHGAPAAAVGAAGRTWFVLEQRHALAEIGRAHV